MPCGPICPASDALCIAGFKTGWRLWPPTRASFLGRGQATQKNTLEASKGNQNQPYLIQLGEGLPTLSLPPCLVSVAQFSFFPQLYQIQLVLVTLRLAAKGGPPDRNSPNLHVKSQKTWKNIGFTSFSSCFHHLPFPNRIRYGWFRTAPQRRTRGDSSLWPQGTVTELLSGTSPKSGIQNPKFTNPKSKIQTFSAPFRGFWILDSGFWILDRYVAFLYMRPPPPQISGILDFGFWISDFGFWILDFGFRILDFGFWILDFGFWILDFGFRILDFGFWILDFGFWISDFGALCSNSSCANFGFRILDFGFRILDFGFWFGGVFADIFWMLHNIIITVHADLGRRIYCSAIFGRQVPWHLPVLVCGLVLATKLRHTNLKDLLWLVQGPDSQLRVALEPFLFDRRIRTCLSILWCKITNYTDHDHAAYECLRIRCKHEWSVIKKKLRFNLSTSIVQDVRFHSLHFLTQRQLSGLASKWNSEFSNHTKVRQGFLGGQPASAGQPVMLGICYVKL